MMRWSLDDVRIIGDIVLGSLLAGAVRLVIVKAFLEPAAMWVGQQAYRRADQALGDRLPDLFRGEEHEHGGVRPQDQAPGNRQG